MPEKERGFRFQVTGPARRDIAAIIKWSLKEFGMNASLRYSALLRQALLDIEADSERPGSKERPELMVAGARTYHISLSRTRVSGARVKEPRHLLLYRRREDGVVEVARVLHDGRDLRRHLPDDYRGLQRGDPASQPSAKLARISSALFLVRFRTPHDPGDLPLAEFSYPPLA